MNKVTSIAAIVALTSTFSFSQEQENNASETSFSQEQEYNPPQEQEYSPPQEQEYSPPQEQEYSPPQKQQYSYPQEQKNTIEKKSSPKEFGVRGAFNFTTQALQLDESSGNSFGLGFVVGVMKRISIIENVLFLSPGFEMIYRNICDECTLNTSIGPVEVQGVYEYAFSIPLLIQLEIIRLYIEGGVQFDLPLFQYVTYKSSYGAIDEWKIDRETFDFGYAAGLGWKFADGSGAIGLRGFYGITGKYGEKENPKKLIQGGLVLTIFM